MRSSLSLEPAFFHPAIFLIFHSLSVSSIPLFFFYSLTTSITLPHPLLLSVLFFSLCVVSFIVTSSFVFSLLLHLPHSFTWWRSSHPTQFHLSSLCFNSPFVLFLSCFHIASSLRHSISLSPCHSFPLLLSFFPSNATTLTSRSPPRFLSDLPSALSLLVTALGD